MFDKFFWCSPWADICAVGGGGPHWGGLPPRWSAGGVEVGGAGEGCWGGWELGGGPPGVFGTGPAGFEVIDCDGGPMDADCEAGCWLAGADVRQGVRGPSGWKMLSNYLS